ncbi:pumilio homolog 12-like [Macadamia integrifolia]|uniref:pumilio homolog 12-like n=1 Tax=Macadamia integrifolia TaxID=60698 RepID=UPI001C4E8C96|nr:pumilio homolog 12-like [Macadamia integrifolia]
MIFAEVKDHVGELMIHSFGNYLVQRLLEVCTDEQKMEVLSTITKEEFQLVTICLDTHGTRAVQKLLEHLTTPEQISRVMMALRPGTVILTKDVNGHHVIQNCLQHFSNEDTKYLLNAVSDHCVEIATDSSGCCVLQQCLGYAQGEPRERLFAEITSNAIVLAQDPYGNYVVQYLLGLKIPHVMAARSTRGQFEIDGLDALLIEAPPKQISSFASNRFGGASINKASEPSLSNCPCVDLCRGYCTELYEMGIAEDRSVQ